MSADSMLDQKILTANSNIVAKKYWQGRLSGFEFYPYFNDYCSISKNTVRQYRESLFDIDKRLINNLNALTPSLKGKQVTVLSALGVLAQKCSSVSDVCIFVVLEGSKESYNNVSRLLPFRINDFSGTFSQFLITAKDNFLADLKQANYPVEKMLNRKPDEMNDFPSIAMSFGRIENEENFNELSPDIIFNFNLEETDFFKVRYDADRFSNSYIRKIGILYCGLLDKLLKQSLVQLSKISLITDEEVDKIIHVFNKTEKEFPADKTILDLFFDQEKKTPHNVAVQFKDQRLTYNELDIRSNQVAHYIHERIGTKAAVIGVQLERSVELMIAVFGVLKAGCVYLPVSASYPVERILYTLRDSSCAMLIAEESELSNFQEEFTCASVENMLTHSKNRINLAEPVDIAYLIYTSGSTGRPKGVLIKHRSLVNRLHWMQNKYELLENDVILQKTAIVFDVSIWELFWWSFTGAKLVLAEPGAEKDPVALSKLIDDENITVLHFVPSMLNAWLNYLSVNRHAHSLASIKHLFSSGEELSAADANNFLKMNPLARLHNLYGPTEATVDVSYYEVLPGATIKKVPIGKPIDNTQLLIFNQENQLQPVGIAGELFIGGENLAKGYINKIELTHAKFVRNPLDNKTFLYRTGDLARWGADGNIEFLGRIDNQIKLRGYRIEIGEIENSIESWENVAKAIVLLNGSGSSPHLVAYVMKKHEFSEEELRDFLKSRLPDYMMPSYVIFIEKVPATVNGKVDRKALLALKRPMSDSFVPPTTEIEKSLLEQWKVILEREKISIRDNFFRIGGDSILAVRLIGAINHALAINLSMVDFFEHQTIEQLGIFIESSVTQGNSSEYDKVIDSVDDFQQQYLSVHLDDSIEAVYPMSDIEKGMSFVHLANPDDVLYFEQNVISILYENFRFEVLERAMDLLVEKHLILRTGYDLNAFAHIVYKTVKPDVDFHDLSLLDKAGQRATIESYTEASRLKHFDFNQAPMWRMRVFKLNAHYHVMIYEVHHAIFDGWSFTSFLTELNNTYGELSRNASYTPGALEVSYKDFIVEELYQKQNENTLNFWKQYLSGYKKIPIYSFQSEKKFRTVVKDYDLNLLPKLEYVAKTKDTSIKHLFFAAYVYALKLLTDQQDVVVGLVGFNRPLKKDGDKLLGCFLNTIPFRVNLSDVGTWAEYVGTVEEKLQNIRKYDSLSLFEINRAIGGNAEEGNPLFDTLFTFVNFYIFNELKPEKENSAQSEVLPFSNFLRGHTFFDVTMHVNADGIQAKYDYVTSFMDDVTFNTFLSYYESIIEMLANRVGENIDNDRIRQMAGLDSPMKAGDHGNNPETIIKRPVGLNTRAGKNALPEFVNKVRSEYVAPTTKAQLKLVEIWKELLAQDNIGINDNFFESGGHSLSAMRLAFLIKNEFGIDLKIKTIYEYCNIKMLSEFLEGQTSVSAERDNVNDLRKPNALGDDTLYEILKIQTFRYLRYKAGVYTPENSVMQKELGDVNQTALSNAVDTLVARHESLRTLFVDRGGELLQQVYSADKFISNLSFEDVCGEENKADKIKSIINEMVNHLFDFEKERPFKCKLIRYEKSKCIFIFVIDHIITDAHSNKVIEEELLTLYNAYSNGMQNPLEPIKIQLKDYTRYHNAHYKSEKLRYHQRYFKSLFNDIPPKLKIKSRKFPSGKKIAVETSGASGDSKITPKTKGGLYVFFISKEIQEQIRVLTSRLNVSFFNFILAAYSVFLQRISYQNDFVIDTPMSTRNRKEFLKIIGWLMGVLVSRVKVDNDRSFTDLLFSCRNTIAAAMDHIHYQTWVNDLGLEWSELVSTQLNVLTDNSPQEEMEDIEPRHFDVAHVHFDIAFTITVTNNNMRVNCRYRSNVIDKSEVPDLCKTFVTVLKMAVSSPDIKMKYWKKN